MKQDSEEGESEQSEQSSSNSSEKQSTEEKPKVEARKPKHVETYTFDEAELREVQKQVRQVLNRVSEQNLTDMFQQLIDKTKWETKRQRDKMLFCKAYTDIFFQMIGADSMMNSVLSVNCVFVSAL